MVSGVCEVISTWFVSRGGRISSYTTRSTEVIKNLWLRDIPLQGGPFTWRGEQQLLDVHT